MAAAAASLFIPGARLLYEGQLDGWQVKSPVQLGRIQEEATDLVIEPFYRALVGELRQAMYHDGLFTLIESQHEQVLVVLLDAGPGLAAGHHQLCRQPDVSLLSICLMISFQPR